MLDDPILMKDWHPVAKSEQLGVKEPLSVYLLEEQIVLWRMNDQVMAWQDLCIHRGCPLSLGKIKEETLVCAYHGWRYNEEGQCVHIPAHPKQAPPQKARVKTYHAQERYGLVWVSLTDGEQEIPPFPEWDDPTYRKILCGPYKMQASGPRIIENFLDIAHFPFVHEGILGDQSHPEIEDYEAEIGSTGVTAKGVRVWQPDPYGTGQGDTVSYTYHVFRPLTAYLAKESDGPRFSILLIVTPHKALQSSAWMWMAMNYAHDTPAEELISWQDEIVSQDIPIVESQHPERLPLDLQAELHLRSDRTAIAYRKWLNQLGLTFGTA